MLKITKLLKLKNEQISTSDTSCAHDGVEKDDVPIQQLTKSETKNKPQQLNKFQTLDIDKFQQLTESQMSMVFKVDNPIKIINVDHVEFNNDSPQTWLSLNHITLINEDKEIIQMGGQLNDKHMNFA